MAGLHVRIRPVSRDDAVEEVPCVFPREIAVLTVHADRRRAGYLLLKLSGPLGDELEAAFRAVGRAERTAKFYFATANRGIAAGLVLSEDGEPAGRELEDGLERVGDGAVIVDGKAAPVRRDAGRGLFSQHPADGVEVVHAPVGDLRGVRVPPAKLVRGDRDLKRSGGAGAEPHVPIEASPRITGRSF